MPTVIVLNGTSSSGKTTIARAFQAIAPMRFLNFSIDNILYALPPDVVARVERGEEVTDLQLPRLVGAYYACVRAILDSGENLVIDHAITATYHVEHLRAAIAGHEALLVGIDCPIEVLEQRERARGNRRLGMAAAQAARIHSQLDYHLRVDSARHSPEEIASAIAGLLEGSGGDPHQVRRASWRRLDVAGSDTCTVRKVDHGWLLEGTATFDLGGEEASVDYSLLCDTEWISRRGHVRATTGAQVWDVTIEQPVNGSWRVNGDAVQGVGDCLDLDFGFTPATNFVQLQRAALQVGQTIDFPVAWIDLPPAGLLRLPQHYERRSESAYWYESPTADYCALLELAPSGFVRVYPELWLLEG